MIRYETLMLTSTEITDDELLTLEKSFDSVCSSFKGTVSRFDKWGKYRLAYPVNKSAYGVYVLVRFELPAESISKGVPAIDNALQVKFNELVWRHVTVRLAPNAPVDYVKPDPVDVARTTTLDAAKSSKVSNFLDSVDNVDLSDRADDEEAHA